MRETAVVVLKLRIFRPLQMQEEDAAINAIKVLSEYLLMPDVNTNLPNSFEEAYLVPKSSRPVQTRLESPATVSIRRDLTSISTPISTIQSQ